MKTAMRKVVILLNVSDQNNRWNKMALAYLQARREGWTVGAVSNSDSQPEAKDQGRMTRGPATSANR